MGTYHYKKKKKKEKKGEYVSSLVNAIVTLHCYAFDAFFLFLTIGKMTCVLRSVHITKV